MIAKDVGSDRKGWEGHYIENVSQKSEIHELDTGAKY